MLGGSLKPPLGGWGLRTAKIFSKICNSEFSDLGTLGQLRKLRVDLKPIKIFSEISNSEFMEFGIGPIWKLRVKKLGVNLIPIKIFSESSNY